MRVNYILNDQYQIISWYAIPFDEKKPYITLQEDPHDVIHLYISQVINGQFVENLTEYQNYLATRKIEENIKNEINQLKSQLQLTDYLTMKYMEGQLSEEEWDAAKIKRQEWRDRINELENELK